MNANDRRSAELALGRILRMGARPSKPGDVEEYERCRRIIVTAMGDGLPKWTPNYARDRHSSVMRGD